MKNHYTLEMAHEGVCAVLCNNIILSLKQQSYFAFVSLFHACDRKRLLRRRPLSVDTTCSCADAYFSFSFHSTAYGYLLHLSQAALHNDIAVNGKLNNLIVLKMFIPC